jgi:hypothetical protein
VLHTDFAGDSSRWRCDALVLAGAGRPGPTCPSLPSLLPLLLSPKKTSTRKNQAKTWKISHNVLMVLERKAQPQQLADEHALRGRRGSQQGRP